MLITPVWCILCIRVTTREGIGTTWVTIRPSIPYIHRNHHSGPTTYMGQICPNIFKAPSACPNSWSKNKRYGHQLEPMTHFFTKTKNLTHFYIFKVKCLIHICVAFFCPLITKKGYAHQLGPMTHFFTNQKLDPLSYIWHKSLPKDFQSSLCMP